jgi:KaiC/GvpD/RAD55 family RecA-like ATPase
MPKTGEQKLKPTVAPLKRGSEEKAPQRAAPAAPAPVSGERVPSGIPGLDELIGGGFEPASTTLVMGDAGTGKTTFLSQFLYNGAVQYNEPGVLLTFEESAPSIERHMEKFGFDFKALEEKFLFATINYRPHEVKKLVDEGGGLILDTISSLGAKRLAIDSLTSYAMLFETSYQAREGEIALFDLLYKWKCTTLLSAEGLLSKKNRSAAPGGVEHLADGIILMHHPRHQSVRYRAIEILKMRGSKQSEKVCPFEFVEGLGIRIYPGEEIFYDLTEKDA